MMKTINTNNTQSSKSWFDWMNQSTIHNRNVARRRQAQGISDKNETQIPVAIRVCRTLFTSKGLPQQNDQVKAKVGQANILESFPYNEYDPFFADTLSYYDGACEESRQQPMFADDSTTFTYRSINSSTPTSNLFHRSIMMAGLVSSIAIASKTVAAARYNNSTLFTTFLLANGSGSKNFPMESMEIVRNSYRRLPNQNGIKAFPQLRSPSRLKMLLLAWGGYEVLSNLILGPRSY